jgi:hypothetical protein
MGTLSDTSAGRDPQQVVETFKMQKALLQALARRENAAQGLVCNWPEQDESCQKETDREVVITNIAKAKWELVEALRVIWK